MHQMQIRITTELHRKVKAKAALQGKTISGVVRELLERWERGEIELPDEPEE